MPVYQLKEQPELWDDGDLTTNMYLMAGTGMGFYGNSNAGTKKRILIFHDSFLQDSVEFYYTRYSQVFMTNRQNYEHLQYYVNLLQPDAVIFENAERAFVDDLYAYTNLSNVEYEPSYTSFQSLQKAEESGNKIQRESEFVVEITEAENATYEGNVVSLDSDRTYYNLRGEIQIPSYLVQSHSRLHLYAKYKKKYYEINYSASESGYEALRSDCPGVSKKQVGEPSNQLEFYISLRRQKEMKGKMKLVLVDEEKNVEYQVGTLSLKFADQ